jgi:hypothetical protein
MRFVALLVIAGACSDGTIDTRIVDDDEEVDLDGPVITHTPVTTPMPFAQDVLLEASVEDASGVLTVELIYQQETAVAWTTRAMSEVGGGRYQGTIPGGDVYSGGMRYFLRATDLVGNTACEPRDCEIDAWRFGVTAD